MFHDIYIKTWKTFKPMKIVAILVSLKTKNLNFKFFLQVLPQPDQNKSGDSGKPGKEENKDAKKPAEEAKDKPAAEKKDDVSK